MHKIMNLINAMREKKSVATFLLFRNDVHAECHGERDNCYFIKPGHDRNHQEAGAYARNVPTKSFFGHIVVPKIIWQSI